MTEKSSHANTSEPHYGILARFISAAIAVFAITTSPLSAHGQAIRFANETADTARITRILVDECKQKNPGNVERLARQFIGTPYAAGTLEHSPETLTINLDSLDCTTFVETVLALAYTAAENRPSWRDFAYNLRRSTICAPTATAMPRLPIRPILWPQNAWNPDSAITATQC